MEKVMGFESLPFDVLEVIASYLSARDLARCLGVCRTWYNILSNDIFWKRHCMANASDYFSKAKCLVEPAFKPPIETPLPVPENRLQFLREQNLWKNWDKGRFKKEEIVFDCDETISYNIKVSFLDNDHVCLHRTFETEVWNVEGTPYSVMTIPYCLQGLWEVNIYKVVENDLIVIQCNVVQVYKISLDSKSWSLKHVFFYNKSEDFSYSISTGTDIEALFQQEDISEENDFERVICGRYVVGACMKEESPLLHIWDIETGKKVKEDKYENCSGKYSIGLKAPKESTPKVLVTFIFKSGPGGANTEQCSSIVYDLSQMKFMWSTHLDHSGDVMYFDGNLSVLFDNQLKILRHSTASIENDRDVAATMCVPDLKGIVTSIQPLGGNLLITTRNHLYLIKASEKVLRNANDLSILKVHYKLSHAEVLFNRYILLHDVNYQSIRELWRVNKSLRRVREFPHDSGTYAASNKACSKVVFERGNKLIVVNFW